MSKVNQLLAKAMSTSSEDEAIACLRMARKQGSGTFKAEPDQKDTSLEKLRADLLKAVNAAQTWANLYGNEVEAKRRYQRQHAEMQKVFKQYLASRTKKRIIVGILIIVAFALGATVFPPEIIRACILF